MRSATAYEDASGSTANWTVDVTFTAAGQRHFTDLTRSTLGAKAPQNQIAVVVDGVVQSAPVTESVIAGDAQIVGDYNRSQADQVAAVLATGALPARLQVSAAGGG